MEKYTLLFPLPNLHVITTIIVKWSLIPLAMEKNSKLAKDP